MSIMISVDNTADDNLWWKDLLKLFASPGEYFEIHCWTDEKKELQIAEKYGQKACYGMPDLKIVHGSLSDKLISYLLNEAKPSDCECYNKMIPFFTIIIGEHFFSEKYGTEIILTSRSPKEERQIEHILSSLEGKAKIYRNIDSQNSWRKL